LKQVAFYLGCVAAWFIFLPIFLVGGGIALLTYALSTELVAVVVGDTNKFPDNSTAREIARRMCLRH
jgi:hypothetical protein